VGWFPESIALNIIGAVNDFTLLLHDKIPARDVYLPWTQHHGGV
jgi:hypothetical protein